MRFDVKMPIMRAKTKQMLFDMEPENKELFVSLKKAFEVYKHLAFVMSII